MNTPKDAARPPQPRRSHWARRTHRVVAMTSLAFLVLIALSGLALNHADSLGLTRRYLPGSLLPPLYGMETPQIDAAVEAGSILFAFADGVIYADSKELARDAMPINGAVKHGDEIIVSSTDEFFVMTSDAVMIERFVPLVDGPITQLGTTGERVIVATVNGHYEFNTRQMSLSETEIIDIDQVSWSHRTTLGEQTLGDVQAAVLGKSLSWERVLGDLHSGRILPGIGIYIADLSALCILYLCFSGIIMWFRRR